MIYAGWYIHINGRSENASLTLWATTIDFQYHIVGYLGNDYPQMVTTYCCLVKGNPVLIWLHKNRVYVWESGNHKTRGTARWVARSNERASYIPWCNYPISLCCLQYYSLLVIEHTSPLLERLYIPVTFVWGPMDSSTRLVRKVSQFRVPSF